MSEPRSVTRRAMLGSLAVTALLLTFGGCANQRHTTQTPDTTAEQPADVYASPANGPKPNVVRTGRYQLVPLAPTSGQRDLLRQAVTIDLPQSMRLTVRDGLVHVLRDSGLRLCPHAAQTGLFSSPLPAVHRELGPTTLADALQVLAGPAWRLDVDYAQRTVCFDKRPESAGKRNAKTVGEHTETTASRS